MEWREREKEKKSNVHEHAAQILHTPTSQATNQLTHASTQICIM